MKKFVQTLIATLVAMFMVSCGNSPSSNNTAINYGGGGGGGGQRRMVSPASPRTASSSSIFGNQPRRPTSDAVSTTWQATQGTAYWWNDQGGDLARLQIARSNEPILYSRANNWAWREGCFNRVAGADSPKEAEYEEIASNSGGGVYQDNRSQTSYAVEINMPIFFNGGGGGGLIMPQPRCRPQQRGFRPQPIMMHRPCPPHGPICPPGTRPVRRR